MIKHLVTVPLLLYAIAMTNVHAQDRVELPGTSIIGNRELPKVLYIVPWKRPNADNLMGNPVGRLVNEALSAVDRDVFLRQIEYHDIIANTHTSTDSVLKK